MNPSKVPDALKAMGVNIVEDDEDEEPPKPKPKRYKVIGESASGMTIYYVEECDLES